MGRILIADDHDSLRRGLALALGDAGHDVDEAPNGNAAIEKLHEGFYDVVVSDLKMGGSTGIEVLKTTKSLHPNTAVILMTAFGTVSTAVDRGVERMSAGVYELDICDGRAVVAFSSVGVEGNGSAPAASATIHRKVANDVTTHVVAVRPHAIHDVRYGYGCAWPRSNPY